MSTILNSVNSVCKAVSDRMPQSKKKCCFLICVVFMVGVICVFGNNVGGQDLVYAIKSYATKTAHLADSRWTYECRKNICKQTKATQNTFNVSLDTCNMLCGLPTLWPRPTLEEEYVGTTKIFFAQQLYFITNAPKPTQDLLNKAMSIFNENILAMVQNTNTWQKQTDIKQFVINITFVEDTTNLRLDTEEMYSLKIDYVDNDVIAEINALTYFGARHGLETLSQLIWWDEIEESLRVMDNVRIQDRPKFPYRGLMIDTARNYFSLETLKKVVEGMAANKLNVFHWHITDAHSFPLKTKHTKKFAKYGAYSPSMTYNTTEIQEFVEFCRVRGVRVVIEVDAPAHINKGWLWGPEVNLGNLVICEDSYSMEGQVNASNPHVLDLLENIYKDLIELNTNNEIFHIGGDEVNVFCWRNKLNLNNSIDMFDYWAEYVQKMTHRIKKANNGHFPDWIVMWSSPLTATGAMQKYLSKKHIVVQHWFGDLNHLLSSGYNIIFSTVGKWYLDCGFGKWRETKDPVCDPYTSWQTFYGYAPWRTYDAEDRTLGGEVCLWSEQVEEDSVETRIWPRTAAFAERMWSDPIRSSFITTNVYTRMDTQRKRMIGRGLKAEALWPRVCSQNPGLCY